jgi:glutamate formiminotransferase
VIETIPNVSEGRRPEVIAEIVKAVTRTEGVWLLDHSADPSHNRSVFTMVGGAEGLRSALLRLFDVAVARIDLRTHRGVHPRLGAVDVVPFVPLAPTTMGECVDLSRSMGREIAERFNLPVFLYEESASHPARRRLEHVRRGQFEGLSEKMRQPQWTPDYGPWVPHPSAGATVVGARPPLIAFNINLGSNDLAIAREVAAAVRESSGGLPCVKALGLPLAHRGVVQVSMNLTNFARTPVQMVFDAVQHLAGERGVRVLDSELIGLIPSAALAETTPDRLKLAGFNVSQFLEVRIRERVGGGQAGSSSASGRLDGGMPNPRILR